MGKDREREGKVNRYRLKRRGGLCNSGITQDIDTKH